MPRSRATGALARGGLGRGLGAPKDWVPAARDAFVPLLGAAGVIGAMPNIVSNRLNSQF